MMTTRECAKDWIVGGIKFSRTHSLTPAKTLQVRSSPCMHMQFLPLSSVMSDFELPWNIQQWSNLHFYREQSILGQSSRQSYRLSYRQPNTKQPFFLAGGILSGGSGAIMDLCRYSWSGKSTYTWVAPSDNSTVQVFALGNNVCDEESTTPLCDPLQVISKTASPTGFGPTSSAPKTDFHLSALALAVIITLSFI